MITIRKAVVSDLPYLYEICFETAFVGKSARGLTDDRFKVGHYFAAPYLMYDEGIGFVAVKDRIPCGYVLGVADTIKYTKWLNSQWLPQVRSYYSFEENKIKSDFDAFLNSVIRNDTEYPNEVNKYPAHLHIDLLPEIQGQGVGRKLIHAFFDECRSRNVKSVHLVVAKSNTGAVAFYEKIGMKTVLEMDTAICMGYEL